MNEIKYEPFHFKCTKKSKPFHLKFDTDELLDICLIDAEKCEILPHVQLFCFSYKVSHK